MVLSLEATGLVRKGLHRSSGDGVRHYVLVIEGLPSLKSALLKQGKEDLGKSRAGG